MLRTPSPTKNQQLKQTVRVNRVTNNDVEINQDDDITADPTDDEIVNNIFESGEVLMKKGCISNKNK